MSLDKEKIKQVAKLARISVNEGKVESLTKDLNSIFKFIEQLNSKQFKSIEDFFTTMPKLTHTLKVKNPQTNVESSVVLEGLAAFFS